MSLYGTELPAVPSRRHQAVPEGHQVLHREVPGRAPSVCARPARPEHGASPQVVGVLEAAAREAEDQAHLRRVSEQQFRNTFEKVTSLPGITGHNLLAALESRLDNMVYRMGFAAEPQGGAPAHSASPRRGERQAVDIPSYHGRAGRGSPGSRRSRARWCPCSRAMEQASRGASPSWLAVDRDTFSGRMLERPSRPNIPIAAQEQLVVELYSK